MTPAELKLYRQEIKPLHPVQMRTVGKLLNDLYMTNRIGIDDVRQEYRKMKPDDQMLVLEGIEAVLAAALQAGIGELGSFEGIERG